MGLLDELVGSLAGSGEQVSRDQAGTLVRGVLDALGSDGADAGLDGLLQRLQAAGLGAAIASWIGAGANQSVPPDPLAAALRGSPFESVTKRAGLGGVAGAAILASLLPKLIDNLSKIAKRIYGDANQWRRIFDATRGQLTNPDLIHPGQVLNIPE